MHSGNALDWNSRTFRDLLQCQFEADCPVKYSNETAGAVKTAFVLTSRRRLVLKKDPVNN